MHQIHASPGTPTWLDFQHDVQYGSQSSCMKRRDRNKSFFSASFASSISIRCSCFSICCILLDALERSSLQSIWKMRLYDGFSFLSHLFILLSVFLRSLSRWTCMTTWRWIHEINCKGWKERRKEGRKRPWCLDVDVKGRGWQWGKWMFHWVMLPNMSRRVVYSRNVRSNLTRTNEYDKTQWRQGVLKSLQKWFFMIISSYYEGIKTMSALKIDRKKEQYAKGCPLLPISQVSDLRCRNFHLSSIEKR